MAENKRERLQKLHRTLKDEYTSWWLPEARDLSQYILRSRARFLVTDKNRGDRRSTKIIDPTATLAARTQRAGMFTGITSPARPWFALQTPDPDLMESGAVKNWLHSVEERMRTTMLRSNLYNALPVMFGDTGTFGTGAFIVLEDARTVFRCFSLPPGSYYLAQNDSLRVDTLTREYTLTVRQVMVLFGDKASSTVKSLYSSNNTEAPVQITHAICPNVWNEHGMLDAKNMPVTSSYYETKSDGQSFLRESGFETFPAMAPRWDVIGEDSYGSDCPGQLCLYDVKALQLLHRNKAKAAAKQLDPALLAPSSLRHNKISQIPGDVTYADMTTNVNQQVRPLHEVRYDLAPTLDDIRDHQQRISRAYYEDLFMMLAQSDRRDITAREIEERHEEKMLMLGPVLERLNSELLDPLIDRVFNIMLRRGMFPQPPQELQDMDLKVEYISVMAQAQKSLSAAGIERFSGFVGSLAAGNPEVIDKYDMDQAIDEYGSITGVPPRLIRPDDQAAQIRQARAEKQAEAERVAMAGQLAQGAKTLSQTDTSRDNALTQLLGG